MWVTSKASSIGVSKDDNVRHSGIEKTYPDTQELKKREW